MKKLTLVSTSLMALLVLLSIFVSVQVLNVQATCSDDREDIVYYIPFLYQGVIYDSGVHIQNDGDENANVKIQFYYMNGTLAGDDTFTVQPGESMTKHVFDITGTMPIYVGPAIVKSDEPIQVQGFINTVNEGVYSIAPSFTKATNRIYIPFLYQSVTYDAGVQVFNPGTVATNVTIDLYYQNGTLANRTTYLVDPKVLIGHRISEILENPTIFVGPAEISSDQPIVAQAYIRSHPSNIYSIVPAAKAVNNAYIPYLYSEDYWGGGIQVFNPSTKSINVTIDLHYMNGTLANRTTYLVDPKVLIGHRISEILVNQIFNGYAEISSDEPIVTQSYIRNGTSLIYYVLPQLRKPHSSGNIHLPFLYQTVNGSYNSSIQVLNPNSVMANISIKLMNSNGSKAGEFNAAVSPHTEISRSVYNIAPNNTDFDGYAIVDADQNIISQGMMLKQNTTNYSIFPPIER